MPEHLKINLHNIEIDSNLTYPSMVVLDFKKDPRKHFFMNEKKNLAFAHVLKPLKRP